MILYLSHFFLYLSPNRTHVHRFSRDLQRLDDQPENNSAEGSQEDDASSAESSDEEEEEGTDQAQEPSSRPNDLNRSNNLNFNSSLQPSESVSTAEARLARKAAKKGGKSIKKEDDSEDDDLDDLANANRSQKKVLKVSEIDKAGSGPMNRKERSVFSWGSVKTLSAINKELRCSDS